MENKQFIQGQSNQVRLCPLENGMLFTISAEAIDDTTIKLINEGIIRPVCVDKKKYRRVKCFYFFKHFFRIPWFKKETTAISFEVIDADKYIGG